MLRGPKQGGAPTIALQWILAIPRQVKRSIGDAAAVSAMAAGRAPAQQSKPQQFRGVEALVVLLGYGPSSAATKREISRPSTVPS